jgi:hypothetical protein
MAAQPDRPDPGGPPVDSRRRPAPPPDAYLDVVLALAGIDPE